LVQLHPKVVGQAVLVVQVRLVSMVVLAVVEQVTMMLAQTTAQEFQVKAIMVVLGQVPLVQAFTAVVVVAAQEQLV
jgi:hypothetical protein